MDFRSRIEQPPRRGLTLGNVALAALGAAPGVLLAFWLGFSAGDLLEGREGPPLAPPTPIPTIQAPTAVPLAVLPTATTEPPREDAYPQVPGIQIPDEGLPSAAPWPGLNLRDGAETWMTFYIGGIGYQVGFYPYAWFPGIFETPTFDPRYSGAVSWVDDAGRTLVWAHSGPDQSMTAIQRFIERDDRGNTVLWSEAERRMAEELMGASVLILQPDVSRNWGRVTAWSRIPPEQVNASLTWVMDLPAYLANLQPGRGWEEIVGTPDVILLYFCGRQLAGEAKDDSRPYWQQTRYVLGIVPGAALDLDVPAVRDVQASLEVQP